MEYNDLCASLAQELEGEYSKREQEITDLENFYKIHATEDNYKSEDFAGLYRKSLILVLYFHFEGYCKQIFQYYLAYINKLNIPCIKAKEGLIAATIHKNFSELNNGNHKPVKLDEKDLNEDHILQLYGRRKEFTKQYREQMNKPIYIPDDFINTESNLKSYVIKKIMFLLEMDWTVINEYQRDINSLVNKRNAYAHGNIDKYPSAQEYDNYKKSAFEAMKKVKEEVYRSFTKKEYENQAI